MLAQPVTASVTTATTPTTVRRIVPSPRKSCDRDFWAIYGPARRLDSLSPGSHAVPRVGLARRLHAQRVDRRARGQEQGSEIGPAEGEVGRNLGRPDDAEPGAVGREDPGTPGAGAVDATVHVDLHAVGDAVGLVGRHVSEDPPPHHVAARVQL